MLTIAIKTHKNSFMKIAFQFQLLRLAQTTALALSPRDDTERMGDKRSSHLNENNLEITSARNSVLPTPSKTLSCLVKEFLL
jgi:hypothetical protein